MTAIADTMQSLYRRFGEIDGVQIELHQSLLAVRVENTRAAATVFLQGAQLSHYQRHDEPAVIWCSPDCEYREGTPLRGGIPICWPWFGDLQKNPSQVSAKARLDTAQAHGFARQRQWQLEDIRTPHAGQTELVLRLRLAADEEPAWPWPTLLTLSITVGESLALQLSVENLSDSKVCFSSALHSYFAVSQIDAISIDGLDGLDYIDCVDSWKPQRQQGALLISSEVDRIYHGTTTPITLIDSGWGRAIQVLSEGSNSAVVWNPWNEKSRRLSQFADDAFRSMICIETANADRDCITLEPGQQHRLNLELLTTILS